MTSTTVYQLAIDTHTSPDTYATETALDIFETHVLPNTIFKTVTRNTDPVKKHTTTDGNTYLTNAFTNTHQDVAEAITTLHTELADTTRTDSDEHNSKHDCAALLNSSDAVTAACTIGEVRGPSTYLYAPTSGIGIRTREEFNWHETTHLSHEPPVEYFSVVPLTVTY